MKKHLGFLLLLAASAASGQNTSPTLQGNNSFTGTNPCKTLNLTTRNSPALNDIAYVNNSSDIGAQINTLLAACPVDANGYQQCEIHLPRSNGGSWSTPVVVTSPGVSIVGEGSYASVFNCSVDGDCLRIYTLPFTVQQAGNFRGFALNGTGTASGSGIHMGEVIGAHFEDIMLNGFTGTNGSAMWMDNADANTWTERNTFVGIALTNSTKLLRFSVEAGNPSMGYNRFLDLRINVGGGAYTGFSLENTAQLYNTTIRATINNSPATSNTADFNLAGTSEFQGELHLFGEGDATYLFRTAAGTALELNSDSSISWATAALPHSVLGGTAQWDIGPTQGTATWSLSKPNFPIQITSLEPLWNLQLNGRTVHGGSSVGLDRFTPSDDLPGNELSGTNAANTAINWSISKAGRGTFNGGIGNANGVVLPSTLIGYHGTSGTYAQLSDGTSSPGNLAVYAADGSVTKGPLMQSGVTASGTSPAVIFAASYSANPNVVVTGVGASCYLVSVSTSGFTATCSSSVPAQWIAIGTR